MLPGFERGTGVHPARRPASLQGRAVASLLLWLAALILTYGLAVVERQIWWLAVPCLTIVLIQFMTVPWALGTVSSDVRIGRALQPAPVVCAVLLLARWHIKDRPLYPWQPDVRRSQLAIEALVPAPEQIGAFNAGIPAYLGSGRVVALDGLGQSPRPDALGRAPIRSIRGIPRDSLHCRQKTRVLDKAHRYSRTPLRLELVASFPLHGWPTGQRHLWRVIAP